LNPAPWTSFLICRELRGFAREIELLADEARIWETLPGVSNSVGTLALHVCGNLQHFVGAVLGGSGYVRDRPFEFAARGLSRERLLAEIAQTLSEVERVLPGLSEAALSAPYPDVLGGLRPPTGLFLQHLACHLSHHLGQAGYLRRTLTGDNRSSGTISRESLAAAM
jgi:uncharacterized damage-inducible protein DinB